MSLNIDNSNQQQEVDPQASSSPKFLDYRDRPDDIKAEIIRSYKLYSDNEVENRHWFVNGSDDYYLCGIEMLHMNLIEHVVSSNPEKKEFNILDIGAGQFQLSRALELKLNNSSKIPKDVKINIISTIAERNSTPRRTVGICEVYELGNFQAENLCDEFKSRNLLLDENVDLIISRNAFTHFVDATGTFLQAYKLLNPGGYLLMDGFYVTGDLWPDKNEFSIEMITLLHHTKSPFLSFGVNYYSTVVQVMDHYILKKTDNHECQIPMQYKKLMQSRRGRKASFQYDKFFDIEKQTRRVDDCFTGDEDLYTYLLINSVLPFRDCEYLGPCVFPLEHDRKQIVSANTNVNTAEIADALIKQKPALIFGNKRSRASKNEEQLKQGGLTHDSKKNKNKRKRQSEIQVLGSLNPPSGSDDVAGYKLRKRSPLGNPSKRVNKS